MLISDPFNEYLAYNTIDSDLSVSLPIWLFFDSRMCVKYCANWKEPYFYNILVIMCDHFLRNSLNMHEVPLDESMC